MHQPIKILFPLTMLRPGQDLLDPQNTETIWEYYLLENISCGLVRDSQNSPTGYEGCIADRFYQENPQTWVFVLRNLCWSDGSKVTDRQIVKWMQNLANKDKRHIQFLKHAQDISYDEKSRVLRIKFPFETDKTILHELSLADAGLFPDEYEVNGWSKTVGPYSVEKWDFKQNILRLKLNNFSPLVNETSPVEAELFRLTDPSQRKEVFRNLQADVVPMSATYNPKSFAEVLPNAPQIFEGFPTAISYFVLNHDCPDALQMKNREIFAEVVSSFKGKIQDTTREMSTLSPEDQMIPNGFNGRIESLKISTKSGDTEMKKIFIMMPTAFKEMDSFVSALQFEFSKRDVNLEIDFADDSDLSPKHFAKLTSFIGNQLDATGSWAFLANPQTGILKKWYNLYEEDYKNVYNLKNISKKDENLKRLHSKVLNTKIAIPVMIGSQKYLISNRVNVDAWNKFDSRLRIYLIKWN